VKALIIADAHLADRPPSIRTETYADDLFAKLVFTVDVAREQRVDAVVYAGDVFHVKAPTRTSHALVQRMARLIKDYGTEVFIVPGNHDMTNDRLESLSKQPLGVLFEAGARMLVGGGIVDQLFGIPWLGDWTAELPSYMQEWQVSDAPLLVTHAPLVQPGDQRPYEIIDAYDWARSM
jgi:DNA repair exonuclease SbcCD nuclease subunit